jgi:dTMP kinase
MSEKHFFGRPLPEVRDGDFSGRLFVIEGTDGSGRSTQIALLSEWLESNGFAVRVMGLRRSNLVSAELDRAKQGNILTRTTLSLFYATDFYDQLINDIVPALRAGLIVLADRYIYTLIARDSIRGAHRDWLRNLYSHAIIPDAVFYLQVSAHHLVERNFQKNATLDYWESGMDLGLSRDMFDSFTKYQRLVALEFRRLHAEYHFDVVNGNRTPNNIQLDLRRKIAGMLEITPGIRAETVVVPPSPPSGRDFGGINN